jgi:CheY-like chemotaxis protein
MMSTAFAQIPREVLAAALKRVDIHLDPGRLSFDKEAARAVTLIVQGDDERWQSLRQFFDAEWQAPAVDAFPVDPGELPVAAGLAFADRLAEIEPTGSDPIKRDVAGSKGMVMVVDDSVTMRLGMRDQLEREGYSVLLAANAWDALGQLETASVENVPAMMFVDVMMPRMNGFQLVHLIQQQEALQGVPIVMMTAGVVQEWAPQMAEINATALVTKPLDQVTVRRQLESNLHGRLVHG